MKGKGVVLASVIAIICFLGCGRSEQGSTNEIKQEHGEGGKISVETLEDPINERLDGIPVSISSSSIDSEYKNNKIKANNKYQNNTVIIHGAITDITEAKPNGKNKFSVHLKNNINCLFAKDKKEKIINLSKGEKIFVKGVIYGVKDGLVKMANCGFIEKAIVKNRMKKNLAKGRKIISNKLVRCSDFKAFLDKFPDVSVDNKSNLASRIRNLRKSFQNLDCQKPKFDQIKSFDFSEERTVNQLSFSPNNRYLAFGTLFNGYIRVIDLKENRSVHEVNDKDGIDSLRFSPDGRFLVYKTKHRINTPNVHILNVKNKFNSFYKYIQSKESFWGAFSPNGKLLTTDDWIIKLKKDGIQKIFEFPENFRHHPVRDVAFSRHGNVLAAVFTDTIRIYNVRTDKLSKLGQSSIDDGQLLSASVSPDGRFLAYGSHDPSISDSMIRVVDLKNDLKTVVNQSATGAVESVSFSPNGKHLIALTDEGSVKVMDANNKFRREVILQDVSSPIEFSPNGNFLCYFRDNQFRLADARNGFSCVYEYAVGPNPTSFTFSSDGKYIAIASNNVTLGRLVF